MAEDKKEKIEEKKEEKQVKAVVEKTNTNTKEVKSTSTTSAPNKKKIQVKRMTKKKSKGPRRNNNRDEFDKKIVSIRRVTRVYEGGKRMRLSVCLVIGDKKGRLGIGMGKGADVRAAEEKAYNYAKKHMMTVPLNENTIPHQVNHKKGAAKIIMRPAAPGTGIVAGSSVRAVLEVAGVKDVLTKILGTNNQINNAYAAVEALTTMKTKAYKEARLNNNN